MIDTNVIEQARKTDIITFFESSRGLRFFQRGDSYRCCQHPSLAVKEDRLSWYWHSKGCGGYGIFDYLIKVEGMHFQAAAEAVVSGNHPYIEPQPQEVKQKMLILPEKAEKPLRLYDYLYRDRGIGVEIILTLIREEMVYEDVNGNVVFVGYDEHGIPRYATLRGTYGEYGYRADCAGSDKSYGFHLASARPNKLLYVFESAIDAISHATIANLVAGYTDVWQRDNRLSLGGVTDKALAAYLEAHGWVNELIFCTDNDAPGRKAAAGMARKYADKGYRTRLALPEGKDYNDDLLDLREKMSKGYKPYAEGYIPYTQMRGLVQ